MMIKWVNRRWPGNPTNLPIRSMTTCVKVCHNLLSLCCPSCVVLSMSPSIINNDLFGIHWGVLIRRDSLHALFCLACLLACFVASIFLFLFLFSLALMTYHHHHCVCIYIYMCYMSLFRFSLPLYGHANEMT